MRPRWRVLLAALVATLAVAGAAGCGATGGSAGSVGTPAAATAGVPELLRFDSQTLDGKAFAGASLAGRPVVLWFWAPWCASCAGQAPSVQELATTYGSRVAVVGVAGLGETAAMHTFIKDYEVAGVTHLNDQAGAVWRRFQITHQSVYVLLDAKGTVLHSGWLDSQELPERVKAMAG